MFLRRNKGQRTDRWQSSRSWPQGQTRALPGQWSPEGLPSRHVHHRAPAARHLTIQISLDDNALRSDSTLALSVPLLSTREIQTVASAALTRTRRPERRHMHGVPTHSLWVGSAECCQNSPDPGWGQLTRCCEPGSPAPPFCGPTTTELIGLQMSFFDFETSSRRRIIRGSNA